MKKKLIQVLRVELEKIQSSHRGGHCKHIGNCGWREKFFAFLLQYPDSKTARDFEAWIDGDYTYVKGDVENTYLHIGDLLWEMYSVTEGMWIAQEDRNLWAEFCLEDPRLVETVKTVGEVQVEGVTVPLTRKE